MNELKCLYVNTHFAPDFHYGGVVESSSKIFKYLKGKINLKIIAVSSNPSSVGIYVGESGKCYQSIIFHRFGLSLSIIVPLCKEIVASDIVWVNGIFTFPTTLAKLFCILFKRPFVVSIRGGLEPWRLNHNKFRKFLFNRIICFPLLRRAESIHVTSLAEFKSLQDLGFYKLKLISNGVDAKLINDFIPKERTFFKDNRFVFLFLSRTDKEKGVDLLIAAYKKFTELIPKERHLLAIIGPDNQGYLKNMKLAFDKLNITRIDGLYESDKYQVLYEADCVLFPSYSENFGNVVAESLAIGKPVLTTTGTPWADIEKYKLGAYFEPSMSNLLNAMLDIYEMSKLDRGKLSIRAKKYIFEQFDWDLKANEFNTWLRFNESTKI